VLQACLNGSRAPDEHPALPVTPEQLAEAARTAVDAGAETLHIHPKDGDGKDSLAPDLVAAAVSAVRAAAPGVPVGTTTGAWAVVSPSQRFDVVRSWQVVPDFASVNWHEDGAAELAELLIERGIGVEAGLWTRDIAAEFVKHPLAPRCLRIMGEPMEGGTDALIQGAAIGVAVAELGMPVLLHGMNEGAWPVLRMAASRLFDVRIGLEDVLTLPDGTPAPDNAALVAAAKQIIETR
jgi:uncharacterized protein (DUF849 family)